MADTKTSRNPLVKKLLKDLGNTPVDQPTSVSSETGMDPSKALELIQTALNNHDATQKRWPAPQKIPTFPVYAHGVLVNVPQGKRPGPHPDYIGADDDELLRGAIGTTPQMVAPSPVVPAVPGNTSPLQRALGSPDFITELRKDVHARAGKHRVVPESEHGYLDWDERKAKWMQEQSGRLFPDGTGAMGYGSPQDASVAGHALQPPAPTIGEPKEQRRVFARSYALTPPPNYPAPDRSASAMVNTAAMPFEQKAAMLDETGGLAGGMTAEMPRPESDASRGRNEAIRNIREIARKMGEDIEKSRRAESFPVLQAEGKKQAASDVASAVARAELAVDADKQGVTGEQLSDYRQSLKAMNAPLREEIAKLEAAKQRAENFQSYGEWAAAKNVGPDQPRTPEAQAEYDQIVASHKAAPAANTKGYGAFPPDADQLARREELKQKREQRLATSQQLIAERNAMKARAKALGAGGLLLPPQQDEAFGRALPALLQSMGLTRQAEIQAAADAERTKAEAALREKELGVRQTESAADRKSRESSEAARLAVEREQINTNAKLQEYLTVQKAALERQLAGTDKEKAVEVATIQSKPSDTDMEQVKLLQQQAADKEYTSQAARTYASQAQGQGYPGAEFGIEPKTVAKVFDLYDSPAGQASPSVVGSALAAAVRSAQPTYTEDQVKWAVNRMLTQHVGSSTMVPLTRDKPYGDYMFGWPTKWIWSPKGTAPPGYQ